MSESVYKKTQKNIGISNFYVKEKINKLYTAPHYTNFIIFTKTAFYQKFNAMKILQLMYFIHVSSTIKYKIIFYIKKSILFCLKKFFFIVL